MQITMRFSKLFAIPFALLISACLMGVGTAYANDISVTISDLNYTTTVSLTEVQNVVDEDNPAVPYFAQFYKDNALTNDYGWHVLATGTASGQYATVEDVLEAAVDHYNATHANQISLSTYWTHGDTLTLTALKSDGITQAEYEKYYPTYTDVMGPTLATDPDYYFYDLITNATTAFGSAYRSNSWSLNSTALSTTVYNPQNGAVLAWSYGSAQPASLSTMTSGAALAANACNSIAATSSGYPRMIFGGTDGGLNAGKRFCSDITAISF